VHESLLGEDATFEEDERKTAEDSGSESRTEVYDEAEECDDLVDGSYETPEDGDWQDSDDIVDREREAVRCGRRRLLCDLDQLRFGGDQDDAEDDKEEDEDDDEDDDDDVLTEDE
jgi:hypothetical protein